MQVTPKLEGFASSLNIKIGTLPTQHAQTISELCMPVGGPYGGFKPYISSYGEIRCYIVGATALFEFSELYDYFGLNEQILAAQQVPIGEQTLQQLVKDNNDILNSINEMFVPPVSNATTKLELSSLLERYSILLSSRSDPQLIIYGDRVKLTASYETIGLFPNGYLFKSYPEFARPKAGHKVIALVGTDTPNTYIMYNYIDQNGQFIICDRQTPSDTALVTNITYYKQYGSSQKLNYEYNNDGQVDQINTWFVNGKGSFETLSQTYELAIYKADRAAFFIEEGPFITFSFVRTEQQECTAMCLFKDIQDKSLAVEVAVNANSPSNEEPNALPTDPLDLDSHIYKKILKHVKQLQYSIKQFTITNEFNQIQLIAPFDHCGLVCNTYYIVEDGTCNVYVFNLYFETNGQFTGTQEIGRIPDVILPTDGKTGIFNKLKKLIQVVGKGVSWMNDKLIKPIMPITNALLESLGLAGSMVAKRTSVGSSAVDTLFGPNKQQSKQQFRQDFKTFRYYDYLMKKVPIDTIISNSIKLIADELQ
ncbi:MAG: hypothetical protein EZS28_027432 [Streblomastix strix]|uniref:Uncharacterized protein n=1 Tax=Streblomastix strix TaxID=222440 RepID=A0A5J4V3U7_9EUKA|nr:MAG: hypothetical protein EZS28_027432 [Streblomastix strix]